MASIFRAIIAWFQHTATRRWLRASARQEVAPAMFQHTATRRWLQTLTRPHQPAGAVSTHSRPKAAAFCRSSTATKEGVSTHSRPKAAAGRRYKMAKYTIVSTHSRPKAAAYKTWDFVSYCPVSTHSRPKAAALAGLACVIPTQFQHTAARRRLHRRLNASRRVSCFNTQPPEGGCRARRW